MVKGVLPVRDIGAAISYGGGEYTDEAKDIHLLVKRMSHNGLEPSKLHSKDVPFRVLAFQTVQFLKEQLVGKIATLKDVRPSDLQLVYRGTELKGKRSLDDYDLSGTAEKPCVIGYFILSKADCNVGVEPDDLVPVANSMREKLAEVQQSLLSGVVPRLTDDGTGGTYQLYNRTKRNVIAMFKPRDEEAFAPNNPRQYVGKPESEGIRPGTYSTWGAGREVAAYLLDHDNFANVPRTAHVHMKHPSFNNPRKADGSEDIMWKTGSLQEFVHAYDTAGNMSPNQFSVSDCHRIGILDLRIVNMDRNDGNILVVKKRADARPDKSRFALVPIDHGLSLPDRLEVAEDDIVWMGWPQAKVPFDKEELDYIANLNWQKDSKTLVRSLGMKKFPLRLMWVAYCLLQHGAKAGLTLHEIGTIMYRADFEEPSTLQRMIEVSIDAAAYSAHPTPTLSMSVKPQRLSNSFTPDDKRSNQISVESFDLYAGNARLVKAKMPAAVPQQEGRSSSPSAGPYSEQSTPPPCMLPSPRELSDISLGGPPLTDATDEDHSGDEWMGAGGGTVIRITNDERTGTGTGRRISTASGMRAGGGIFSRPEPRTGRETLSWTPEMEKIFRDHSEGLIADCVRHALAKR